MLPRWIWSLYVKPCSDKYRTGESPELKSCLTGTEWAADLLETSPATMLLRWNMSFNVERCKHKFLNVRERRSWDGSRGWHQQTFPFSMCHLGERLSFALNGAVINSEPDKFGRAGHCLLWRGCAGPTPSNKPSPLMYYHVKLGRSTSKDVPIRGRNPKIWECWT